MVAGFFGVFVKMILSLCGVCNTPKRSLIAANLGFSAMATFCLFLVIIMYGSQCYFGDDFYAMIPGAEKKYFDVRSCSGT